MYCRERKREAGVGRGIKVLFYCGVTDGNY